MTPLRPVLALVAALAPACRDAGEGGGSDAGPHEDAWVPPSHLPDVADTGPTAPDSGPAAAPDAAPDACTDVSSDA